jgi:hypothetical protein
MLPLLRLVNQRLDGPKLATAAEVVSWLGAVQAQEYELAKWALGLRMASATETVVERAFNAGRILRTHVLRPTWHFVTPADIRWLLELTAPRVRRFNAYMYRQQALDARTLARSLDVIARALGNGTFQTRKDLGVLLSRVGIEVTPIRLGLIMHDAELEGLVCSGPRQGKTHTYALLADRAPRARQLDREEALGELAARYFVSHGPAKVADFTWWSGLTAADAKLGIAAAGKKLQQVVFDDEPYWVGRDAADTLHQERRKPRGHLLPVYDEYGIAYKDRRALIDPKYAGRIQDMTFVSPFIWDGRCTALWRRTIGPSAIQIEVKPFRPLTAAERKGLREGAERFGAFVERPVQLHVAAVAARAARA